jgi:hypothetical protein
MQFFKKQFIVIILFFIISSIHSQSFIKIYKDKFGNELNVEMKSQNGPAHRVYGIKTNISNFNITNSNIDQNKIEAITKNISETY